jgi:hypothetical protein
MNERVTNLNELYYWAGFLAADGGFWWDKRRNSYLPTCLTIGLSRKDINHLIKLKKFIGTRSSVRKTRTRIKAVNKSYDTAYLNIYDLEIIKTFLKLGIGNYKDNTKHLPFSVDRNMTFGEGL